MDRSTSPKPVTLPSSTGGAPVTVMMYRCSTRLSDLRDTDHPEVKFCDHCSTSVFRARDAEGMLQLVAAGRCTWIETEIPGIEPVGFVCTDDDLAAMNALHEAADDAPESAEREQLNEKNG